ncbi:MAG: hypothetical protein HY403_06890 [Elusimicrobia bacterium]|nr:hypothetical protein [Elusimicrobiota bacterium]
MRRALLLLAFAACACGRSAQEPAAPPVWTAYRGERAVLRFEEGPGPLHSTALLPAGTKPPIHPFLTASALAPEEEGTLRGALESSMSFSDFMERLKKAGYDVRRGAEPP